MSTLAAMGCRAHSGWAAAVAIAAPIDAPVVVDRRRIELVGADDPHGKQPYHAAAKLELKKAENLIAGCLKTSTHMATKAIGAMVADLQSKEHEIRACGVLLGSGRALPEIQKILASHPLLHTAEGVFFRDVLMRACEHHGIPLTAVRERELIAQATARLRLSSGELQGRLTQMGKPLGPPWGRDEKFAALVAWQALAGMRTE